MEEKNRFFLEISYDGTAYHGWQTQPNAIAVQEKLDFALKTFLREEIETLGAGRTDTGVHAKQLFVHFDSVNQALVMNPSKCIKSLNSLLPYDIAIHRLFQVSVDAHARFDATERSYEYHIHFEKNPFLRHKSWLLRDRPNVKLMNEAASLLLGKKDFGCFSKSNTQVFTNICDLRRAEWVITGNQLIFHITADRFLRNMVRAIVGTLLDIGIKGKSPQSIVDILSSQDRSKAGTSVPAHGLYLTEVKYPYIK